MEQHPRRFVTCRSSCGAALPDDAAAAGGSAEGEGMDPAVHIEKTWARIRHHGEHAKLGLQHFRVIVSLGHSIRVIGIRVIGTQHKGYWDTT